MLTKQGHVWTNDLRHVDADFIGRVMIRLSETYLEDVEKVPDADVENEKLQFVNLVNHLQFEPAREIFNRLPMPEVGAKTVPYATAAAEMHSHFGEHEAAQNLARTLRDFALSDRGNYSALYMKCARLFDAAGNSGEAAATRKLAFKNLTDPSTIRKLFRKALKSSAHEDARRIVKFAEEHPVENLELLKTAVKYYSDLKDFAAAEHLLRLLVEKAPEYSGALYRLGTVLARQGKAAEALPILESALAQEPNERSILAKILKASKTLKKPEKMEHYARMILSDSPDDSAAHAMLAQALGRMGRREEALTHAVRAAELEPANEAYGELVKKIAATNSDQSGNAGKRSRELAKSGSE
jgi:tetratricopeptide (TPR) repeat protein